MSPRLLNRFFSKLPAASPEGFTLRYVPSAASTNTELARLNAAAPLPDGYCLYTHCQTAGRGQRDHRWESEPHQNLAMSLLIRPEGISASQQFLLSEQVALGTARTLGRYLDGVNIKWPNDIYYRDLKLAGILIEVQLTGSTIEHAIAGIGVNLNQTRFVSDAPNPVSIRQITGREVDKDLFLRQLLTDIGDALHLTAEQTRANYHNHLYRRTGLHPFRLPDGQTVQAEIVSVEPDGQLRLRYTDNTIHAFYHGEISHVV